MIIAQVHGSGRTTAALLLLVALQPAPARAVITPWADGGDKLLLVALQAAAARADRPAAPVRARNGMVASDSAQASAVGARVLAAGGNAADAACATALALGVVHPFASGLGGGGFALVYLARAGRVFALDFRETAPAGLRREAFLREGRVEPGLSVRGGLAVGVPGEPAGLAELVRRWGKRPFSHCVRPAERLAGGFAASPWLAEQVRRELGRRDDAAEFLARVFETTPAAVRGLRAGQSLRRPDLARTLARMRRQGARAFYAGPLARRLAAAVGAAGGVLSAEDLAGYAPVERTALHTVFRGRRVYGMPPPSSGGVLMFQVLGILSAHRAFLDAAAGPASPEYLHLLAEALKHGFADRGRHLGDPDFVAVPVDRLLAPAYLDELAGRIRPDAVLPSERYGSGARLPASPARDAGTAHISVVDAEGNAVALTTTVNLEFGAHLVAGRTGVLLNNEMDDFALAPEVPNAFGLLGGGQNAVAPGKRPLSSMSPTIVVGEHGVELVAGAAGGPAIISSTLQVLLNVVVFGMDAQAAVNAPRIHHQWAPAALGHEPGLPASSLAALRGKGHPTTARDNVGKVNAIVRTPDGLAAAAEPRSGGAPAGH